LASNEKYQPKNLEPVPSACALVSLTDGFRRRQPVQDGSRSRDDTSQNVDAAHRQVLNRHGVAYVIIGGYAAGSTGGLSYRSLAVRGSSLDVGVTAGVVMVASSAGAEISAYRATEEGLCRFLRAPS
jgi:hypothetical protein